MENLSILHPPSTILLSVVVPAFNEERMIAETLRRLEAYRQIKGQEWEILVVNDGSRDRTASIVQEIIDGGKASGIRLISFEKNRGKGAAVREGILASRGKFVLLTDADLSSPIKEVERLLKALEGPAEVAIGSRALREAGCDVQQTLKRRISGRIFNGLVQACVLPGFYDTQCGFKCFKRQAALDIFSAQKLDGFSFDVEALYLARKKGYQIKEVPVMWRQGESSTVSLFRDSWRMAKDLLTIKKLHG